MAAPSPGPPAGPCLRSLPRPRAVNSVSTPGTNAWNLKTPPRRRAHEVPGGSRAASPGRVSTGWKVSSRPARWAPSGLGRSPRHLAGQQLPAKSRGLKLAPVQPLSASWGGALAGAAGVGEGALQGLSRGCRDLPQALPMCQACFISAHATFTPTGRLTASRSRVS